MHTKIAHLSCGKSKFLSHTLTVILAQVAVGTSNEYAPVFVPEPCGDGGKVDALLDGVGGEEMAEVMMGEMGKVENGAGGGK